MPEAPYFLLKELTILQIELQAGFSEPLERFSQIEQLLELVANHDHIISQDMSHK
jgi:hypothetical protein